MLPYSEPKNVMLLYWVGPPVTNPSFPVKQFRVQGS